MNKIIARIRSLKPDLPGCGLLVFLFVATRFAMVLLGVKPDISHFYNFWQYLDLNLLKSDYFQSIGLLHSQPPLWNAVLGALLIAAGGSDQGFLLAYSSFSFVISLSTALLIFFTLVRLRTARIVALMAASVYIVGSSAYFYEAQIFYPLFTAFLSVAFFSSLAYAFSSEKDAARFALSTLSCICLILLSMTWTLFHPVFVIATSLIIMWRAFALGGTEAGKPAFTKNWLILLTVGILLSLATISVPVKNKVLFNHFGSGSWIGMNLSQAVPGASKKCGFGPLKSDEINLSKDLTKFTKSSNHPAITSLKKGGSDATNYNHLGFLVRSDICKSEAFGLIAQNMLPFAKDRIVQFLISNTMLSDSYFLYPKGMEAGSPARFVADARNVLYIPIPWKGKSRRHLAPLLIPIGLFAGAVLLAFSPALRTVLPKGAIESLVAGLWLMIWLYAVGYLFTGGEQERMRFTVEPLFIAWLSLIGYYCFLILRRPRILTS